MSMQRNQTPMPHPANDLEDDDNVVPHWTETILLAELFTAYGLAPLSTAHLSKDPLLNPGHLLEDEFLRQECKEVLGIDLDKGAHPLSLLQRLLHQVNLSLSKETFPEGEFWVVDRELLRQVLDDPYAAEFREEMARDDEVEVPDGVLQTIRIYETMIRGHIEQVAKTRDLDGIPKKLAPRKTTLPKKEHA